jgi:D-glycero-D-manno-heptose 1,7-bisphosphate phosphatase
MNKVLFLDRDGVINKEKNYLFRISDFEFIDGVYETCRYFLNKGYLIIVVTNQAGIARGMYTKTDFHVLTDWMLGKFLENDVTISRVYYCPHHPDVDVACECRKPSPGMLKTAGNEFNVDFSNSILVGDKNSDIDAGFNAGVGFNFLISTGHSIEQSNTSVPILSNLRELLDIF